MEDLEEKKKQCMEKKLNQALYKLKYSFVRDRKTKKNIVTKPKLHGHLLENQFDNIATATTDASLNIHFRVSSLNYESVYCMSGPIALRGCGYYSITCVVLPTYCY